jgi:putative endonuclease
MKGGWVYIMTNRPNGTLYIGVTADIARRAYEHRTATGSRFTSRYRLTLLVYAEWHPDILTAIQREKTMKEWPRAWKTRLIGHSNPEWRDLYKELI